MKISFYQFRHRIRVLRLFYLFFLCLLLSNSYLSYSQQPASMSINQIFTNGELALRGFTAQFPAPILSTVSVTNSRGEYITGLADTLRWLGKNDIANIGTPIAQIWTPFLEYHEEDNRIPPNPDVYQQPFGPFVTEIRWYHPFPASTMLVMDVSSSMQDEIGFAKAGANAFVDLMRSFDRTGIIQFSGVVRVDQPLTNDTQLLRKVINDATLEKGTAINDGILYAIKNLKCERCRRLVIVYTDGVDVNSTATAAMVIDTSLAYRIPVFTIALGNDTAEDTLRTIAARTGGLFFKAATPNEMEIIYRRLSVLTQNYYVTAHGSTDPNYNDTWRTVDLTANLNGRKVRATGRYYVGGTPPPPLMTDIGIGLKAITDTFMIRGRDSLTATRPGDSFKYRLTVQNYGMHRGDSLRIVQYLPDSVYYLKATTPPEIATSDSLVWRLDHLNAGQIFEIQTTVMLGPNVPQTMNELISTAFLAAKNDTTPENNRAIDTLYVLFPSPPPQKFADLGLEQLIYSDTTIIVKGDTLPAVLWGDSLVFNYKIINTGPSKADSIIFWNIIPDSTKFVDFNIPPGFQRGDTLFWVFDSLAVNDSILISIIGEVVDFFPISPYPFWNMIGVISDNDTIPDNNIDSTLIYAIESEQPSRPLTDLSLKFYARTEMSIVIGQREFSAVEAGDFFEYWIEISNNGRYRADSIDVVQVLPDSIVLTEASVMPKFQAVDTLKWYFDYLNANDTLRIRLNCRVAVNLPGSLTELISSAIISASNDSNSTNNFAEDTIKVFVRTIPVIPRCDLAILHSAMTDSTIFLNNTKLPAVLWGNRYQYAIKIFNNGPSTARDIKLWDVKPDSVVFDSFNQPPTHVSGDSLIWKLDSLDSGDSSQINFYATTVTKFPYSPFPLKNYVGLECLGDSTSQNNLDSTLVMAISRKPDQPDELNYNIAITQSIQADTTIFINNLASPAVFVGNSFPYRLKVINHGPGLAKNVVIWDKLLGYLKLSQFNISPKLVKTDSLFWSIDSLAVEDSVIISFQAVVLENIPYWPLLLENFAGVRAERDTLAKDNDSFSQLYALKRPVTPIFKTDISVYQVAQTDSFRIVNRDTIRVVREKEVYQYRIRVRNERDIPAEMVKIVDYLPDFIESFEYDPQPGLITNDSLIWQAASIPAHGSINLSVKVRVLSPAPLVQMSLINKVVASANNEEPTLLFNNTAFDTVYYLPELPPAEWTAQIQAAPPVIDVGKPVKVKVKTTIEVSRWDLWVYLANGTIDSGYADSFIKNNSLKANEWLEIVPDYTRTQLLTDRDDEQITFELRAWDKTNAFKQSRTVVVILKDDGIDIDHNIFLPEQDSRITIKFKLPQDENAELDLFDITGTRITKIAESQFQAGWNAVTWDGLTEYGQKVGSGFYILTLRSSRYSAWKKLMIVR